MKLIQLYFLFLVSFFFNVTATVNYYLQQASIALKEKNAGKTFDFLHKAYEIAPENDVVVLQLATVHYLLHEYDNASTYYLKHLEKHPTDLNTMYNLGLSYCKQGSFEKALPLFEKVIQQLPNDEILKGTLLKIYLRSKRWEKAHQINPSRLWWYNENIYGKKIVLDLDKPGNGYGDSMQFVRYAQWLYQSGAYVIVKVQRPLVPLFSLCPYIHRIITDTDSLPSHDLYYSICIASLMQCMKDRTNLPLSQPYLKADEKLEKLWQEKLIKDPNFKIGLCCESNLIKDLFSGQVMQSPRSIQLEELQPLSMPGISFYSLQKASKPINAPFILTQFGDDFDNSHGRFMDTAAVIKNCDLIITVDTSIAHLAGALGKPVWVLLTCESDYRWYTHITKSCWYPNMKLFRQQKIYDWSDVILQMQQKLSKIIAQRKSNA